LAVRCRKSLPADRCGLLSKSLYHKDLSVSDRVAQKRERRGVSIALITAQPEEKLMMPENATDQMATPGVEPRLGRSVSLDHAAEILGVSRRTIYNRIREGRLVTIRTLGGSQRVLLDSVQLSKES
jgi:excisionase family DNA binding protein